MNVKKYFIKICLSLIIMPVILANSCLAGEKLTKLSLEDLGPGNSVVTFAALGMPFPDDTAGVHYFINPGDSVALVFYVEGPRIFRRVKWVKLVNRSIINSDVMADGHQMLTRYNIKGISTEKGVAPGIDKKKVVSLMGPPDKNFRDGPETVLEYGNAQNRLVRIRLKNSLVVSVGLY